MLRNARLDSVFGTMARNDSAPKGTSAAKAELAKLGVTLVWNDDWQEFTVKKKGEAGTGYHTTDLEDALGTGRVMARKDADEPDGQKSFEDAKRAIDEALKK